MEYDIINNLYCNNCRTSFSISKEIKNSNDELFFGTLDCSCRSYAIIKGILILQKNTSEHIISLIKKNLSEDDILEEIISLEKFENVFHTTSFSDSVYSLFEKAFSDYLYFRESCKSFFETISFFPVMKKGLFLDFGCGVGKFSYYLNNYFSDSKIISLDQNFISLLLGKRFFHLKNLIYASEDHSLPFQDGIIDNILCSDTFHYIKNKEFFSNEFKRVLSQNGVLLLIHLHNASQHNYFQGSPLLPNDYYSLFKNSKLYSNNIIIKDFFENDKLDLSTSHSEKIVNKSETLSLVYSNNKFVFKNYSNISNFFFYDFNKNNFLFNPAYKLIQEEKSNSIILKLKFPSRIFDLEHKIDEELFPSTIIINKNFYSDAKQLSFLQKNFIILKQN